MADKITTGDYKKILLFYNIPIPKSRHLIKRNAEDILANKLCRCIKKTEPKYGVKSIGICTKTIFTNKGFTRSKFKCKKKQNVTFRRSKK